MSIQQQCIEAYRRHKHLKLTGEELGIPWQTVYVHLRSAGEPVTGDKQRYGSPGDKLAAKAERMFAEQVPSAVDNNNGRFQATIDFTIGGITVDVKSAALKPARVDSSGRHHAARWSFCVNKQRDTAEFFVLYAFNSSGDEVVAVFLIPREIAARRLTISVPASREGMWWNYEVKPSDLSPFFEAMTLGKS